MNSLNISLRNNMFYVWDKWLDKFLYEFDGSILDLSKMLGISYNHLYNHLNGKYSCAGDYIVSLDKMFTPNTELWKPIYVWDSKTLELTVHKCTISELSKDLDVSRNTIYLALNGDKVRKMGKSKYFFGYTINDKPKSTSICVWNRWSDDFIGMYDCNISELCCKLDINITSVCQHLDGVYDRVGDYVMCYYGGDKPNTDKWKSIYVWDISKKFIGKFSCDMIKLANILDIKSSSNICRVIDTPKQLNGYLFSTSNVCPNYKSYKSAGQSTVETVLNGYSDIVWNDEVIYDTCKNKRLLPFDIEFEYKSLKFLIEIDGDFHRKHNKNYMKISVNKV